jgi:hypothetical protein
MSKAMLGEMPPLPMYKKRKSINDAIIMIYT